MNDGIVHVYIGGVTCNGGTVYTPISNTSDCRLSFISRMTVTSSEGRSSNNTSNSTSNGYSTLDDGILRVYQGWGWGWGGEEGWDGG